MTSHATTAATQATALGDGYARGFLIAGLLPLAGAVITALAMPRTRPATHDEAVLAEAEAGSALGGE
jgi:hypothetical protein